MKSTIVERREKAIVQSTRKTKLVPIRAEKKTSFNERDKVGRSFSEAKMRETISKETRRKESIMRQIMLTSHSQSDGHREKESATQVGGLTLRQCNVA